jgi:hypothetical protein
MDFSNRFWDNSIFNPRHDDYPVSSSNEAFCNGVAAVISMPAVVFWGGWIDNSGDTDAKIAALSGCSGCGQSAIYRSALDLWFLTVNKYPHPSQKSKFGHLLNNLGGRG